MSLSHLIVTTRKYVIVNISNANISIYVFHDLFYLLITTFLA